MFGVFWAILLHPKIIKFFQSDLGCSWIFHTAKESCTTTKTSFGPSVLRNTHIYIVIFSHFLFAKQVKHFFFVKKAIIKTKCSWNLNKLIFCPASSKWPFDYPQMEVTKRPRKGHLWVQTVTSHQRSRGSNEISRSCDVAVFFFEKSRSPEKKRWWGSGGPYWVIFEAPKKDLGVKLGVFRQLRTALVMLLCFCLRLYLTDLVGPSCPRLLRGSQVLRIPTFKHSMYIICLHLE